MFLFYCEEIDELLIFEGRDISGNFHWSLDPNSVLRPENALVIEFDSIEGADPLQNYSWELIGEF